MKRLTYLLLLILLLQPDPVSSQITSVTNQYVLNPMTINPAYAGSRGALNLAAYYRRQWVGISGSPETITLSGDAPFLDSRLGLGFSVTSDKVGVTKKTSFQTMYAYKINMNKANFSLGLGAGLIMTNTKWSDLVVIDPGDEIYLSDSRVFVVPDFSFGMYYSNPNFFAGFSMPELLSYKFNYNKNKYNLQFDPWQNYYLLNTGYLFKLVPKVKLLTSTLVTFSPGKKVLYDINVHFCYVDRLWAGASYRNNRSLAALVQFAINNQFRIAYTYDFDFGSLGRYSNGTHEIMFRYEFKYKVDVVNPLIF